MKILIADDHGLIRDGLRALLHNQPDTQVFEAGNGRDCVDMVAEHHPDVVLMDLSMPDLNGIDATRQIMRAHPSTKVVALSARTDGRTVRESLAAGASAFVAKESAFEELNLALEAVVAGRSFLSPRVAGSVIDAAVAGAGVATGVPAAPPPMDHTRLSGREREVLQLTAEGLMMKEIAARLGVSVKTVETHRRQLMQKLQLFSVAELTKYAIREGMTTV